MVFHTFDGGDLSIAELVRASAAFPGIPPRRLRIPPDSAVPQVGQLPRVAFLADGGLWNNLGTQVIREDRFIGTHAAWDKGVLRPHGPAPSAIPLLSLNGSAPLRPTRPWAFMIPGAALVRSFLQVARILSANTVTPRVDRMEDEFDRRVWTGARPDHHSPAELVADLRPTDELQLKFLAGTWTEELIRESDPVVKKWERGTANRVQSVQEWTAQGPTKDQATYFNYIIGPAKPRGSYPVSGLANIEDWDALWHSPAWKELVSGEGGGEVQAPTTLDRIEANLARRILARGYLNTYLLSLFLTPLARGELDRLDSVRNRLDAITGTKQLHTDS